MNAPRAPVLYTLVSLVLIPVCIFKIISAVRKAKRLKLGMEGERAVGQFLERLRSSGAHVLHDVPGENFNIDHVVISCRGMGGRVIEVPSTRRLPLLDGCRHCSLRALGRSSKFAAPLFSLDGSSNP